MLRSVVALHPAAAVVVAVVARRRRAVAAAVVVVVAVAQVVRYVLRKTLRHHYPRQCWWIGSVFSITVTVKLLW